MKIGTGRGWRKEYFKLVLIGAGLAIFHSEMKIGLTVLRERGFAKLPAAKSRKGFQRGRDSGRGDFPKGQGYAPRLGQGERGKVALSPLMGWLYWRGICFGISPRAIPSPACNANRLHEDGLPAFSVGSPMSGQRTHHKSP